MRTKCPGCFALLPKNEALAQEHVSACPHARELPVGRRRPLIVIPTVKEAAAKKRQANASKRRNRRKAALAEQKAAREAEAVARRAEKANEKRLREIFGDSGSSDALRRSRDVDERGERSVSVDAITVAFETNRRRH